MEEFLTDLRNFPQDITTLNPPSIPDIDAENFQQHLKDILNEQDSPSARHTVLQAAAILPPHLTWSDDVLQWAKEQAELAPGRDAIITYAGTALAQGVFAPESWFKCLQDSTPLYITIKEILIVWSGSDFDSFLKACEAQYSHASLRIPISTLLIEALVESPYEPSDNSSTTNMAKVASSSFVDTILKSLILDTGNRLFSINLRLLLAVLPYAPLVLTPKVPLMAIVLGRVISWRDRPFTDHTSAARGGFTQTPLPEPSLKWEVAPSAMEIDIEMPQHLQPRRIAQLYIIAMYGAWPSNVIAFVRDPESYIRGKNVPAIYSVGWDKVWSPGVLATRMEPLIRDFRLHPSLVIFTSTAELADDKRWEKIDAAEFIARSQALSNADQQGLSRLGLFDDDEKEPVEVNISASSDKLWRENELLRLEARFTSRVRKQYLYHIGRLHKTSLRLNNDEAEIHSFVNRLKAQTGQIAELTAQLSQTRTDASQAQQKHVKWQTQLRDKVANFREEKATWQTEAARIRAELSEAHATVRVQREELAEVKNERFKLQNRLTEAEPKIRHISDYETRMKQLTESQRLWDEDVQRCKTAVQEAEGLRARCYELEHMLRASRQETVDQAQTIGVLERKVPTLQRNESNKGAVSPIDSQSNRSQDLEMYIKLLEEAKERNNKLERENLELRDALLNSDKTVDDKTVDGRQDKSFIFDDQVVQ